MNRLAPGHKFLVFLGSLTISFSKISGLSNELSVETINEGGVNDRLIVLYTPKKNYGTLVFEHGRGRINPINKSFQSAALGYYFQLPGTIISFSDKGIERVYGYSKVTPVKWSLSGFDAQNGNVLIDSVEIIHHGVFEIPYS